MEWKRDINRKLPIQVTGYRMCMVKKSTKLALKHFSSMNTKELKNNVQPKIKLEEQCDKVNINFFKQRVERLEYIKRKHKEYTKEDTLTSISPNPIQSNVVHDTMENSKKNEPLFIKKRKLKVKNIILVILLATFIFFSFQITNYLLDSYKSKKKQEKLIEEVIQIVPKTEEEEEQFQVNFDQLKKINPEILGWIRYNQNKINYPIVKTKNNVYYLNHAFDKSYNQTGAIFMDYRNTSFEDQNVILFGHAMLDGTMFGSLGDVFHNGYFTLEENHYILIQNEKNESLVYQIFSYYIIEKEEYYITPSFSNQSEFQTFIHTIQKRSNYNFNVEVSTNDKILTLSTCHGTGNTTKRKVIHAKRIESKD